MKMHNRFIIVISLFWCLILFVGLVSCGGGGGGGTPPPPPPTGTGSWTAMSTTGAPSARALHSSVWTGTEILVWGGTPDGFAGLNTGGRYDPVADSWTAITDINAPTARLEARAQWIALSVNKMIVWGGTPDGYYAAGLNTGGVYDPALNSWTTTTTTNAPSGRFYHTMARSGSTVIVWGGSPDDINGLNTGGVYDPVLNTWATTTTTNAPSARFLHRAVRRGTAETMIVWGGYNGTNALNTGSIYDPVSNSWATTTTTNAPLARADHNMVFAPNIGVIVWGGTPDGNTGLNTGGIYNPGTNSWTAISTAGAPSARIDNTAEWTGTEMIVWGGSPNYTTNTTLRTGGRYDPATDTWAATTTTNAPSARAAHRSDWTGTEMIIWGGTPDYASTLNTGGRYTP